MSLPFAMAIANPAALLISITVLSSLSMASIFYRIEVFLFCAITFPKQIVSNAVIIIFLIILYLN